MDAERELKGLIGDEAVSARMDDRAAHARDLWPRGLVEARDGVAATLPALVVRPASEEDVARIVRWALDRRVPLIPYGGGAGVLGAVAVRGPRTVTVDLRRMASIGDPDPVDHIVRVQPGVLGKDFESHLESRGFTSGHYPQSIPLSTLGGFLATRSSGQASTRYGNIEDLVVAVRAVLPSGEVLATKLAPRLSTGPSLKDLFLGSEGTLGILTEATVRVFPLPEERRFVSFSFPSISAGIEAGRRTVQRGGRPAILRVHDETDASTALVAQGIPDAERGALLLGVVEGDRALAPAEEALLAEEARRAGGRDLGPAAAQTWWKTRYALGERMRDLIEGGGFVDTLEIGASYTGLASAYEAVRARVTVEDALVLCHASHFYTTGANLYFTFIGYGGVREHERVWRAALAGAKEAGASLAHHHGVGVARLDEVEEELGAAGVATLAAIKRALDPGDLLNPGKIGRAPRKT